MALPQTNRIRGIYTVTVTANNSCGTQSQTLTVEVGGDPPTTVLTVNQTQGCAPATMQFNDTGTGSTTRAWSFVGGSPAVSNAAQVSVNYTLPGTYTAQLITSNFWGADTATQLITIGAAPTAQIQSVLVDSFTVTCGAAVAGPAATYVWNFGDGTTASTPSATHNYTSPGTYDVYLAASNACGADTVWILVTISGPIPNATYTVVPNIGCAPLTVQFQDQSQPPATERLWTFVGGNPATSTAVNPMVTYTASGTYGARLIVRNVWGADTLFAASQVTVGSFPTAGFTYVVNNQIVTFTNTSVDENAVLWSFGDGTTSAQSDPSHTYLPGTYTVTLSASNDCGAALIEQTIVITSDAQNIDNQLDGKLTISPNPAQNEVRLSGQRAGRAYQVEVLDQAGRQVLATQLTCTSADRCGVVDVSGLPSGSYRIWVRDADGVVESAGLVIAR
jgi:PKD repeat protein